MKRHFFSIVVFPLLTNINFECNLLLLSQHDLTVYSSTVSSTAREVRRAGDEALPFLTVRIRALGSYCTVLYCTNCKINPRGPNRPPVVKEAVFPQSLGIRISNYTVQKIEVAKGREPCTYMLYGLRLDSMVVQHYRSAPHCGWGGSTRRLLDERSRCMHLSEGKVPQIVEPKGRKGRRITLGPRSQYILYRYGRCTVANGYAFSLSISCMPRFLCPSDKPSDASVCLPWKAGRSTVHLGSRGGADTFDTLQYCVYVQYSIVSTVLYCTVVLLVLYCTVLYYRHRIVLYSTVL